MRKCPVWSIVLASAVLWCIGAALFPARFGAERLTKRWTAMERILSCTPEKPLSRERLFALAMRDYWRRTREDTRKSLAQANNDNDEDFRFYQKVDAECGLRRDRKGRLLEIGCDTCYPWQIEGYATLDILQQRMREWPDHERQLLDAGRTRRCSGGWEYDVIVRDFLHGRVNRPDESPMYDEGHCHADSDFAVLWNRGSSFRWYPRDCCRLLTWTEVQMEQKRLEPGTETAFAGSRDWPPGLKRGDFHFLRVRYISGSVLFGDKKKLDEDVIYYAVSPCGQLAVPW